MDLTDEKLLDLLNALPQSVRRLANLRGPRISHWLLAMQGGLSLIADHLFYSSSSPGRRHQGCYSSRWLRRQGSSYKTLMGSASQQARTLTRPRHLFSLISLGQTSARLPKELGLVFEDGKSSPFSAAPSFTFECSCNHDGWQEAASHVGRVT